MKNEIYKYESKEMTQLELDFINGTCSFTEYEGRKMDPNYIHPKDEEEQKMSTLRESAQAYIPPQTKNIAELDKIPIDAELKDGIGKQGTPEEFTYKYMEVNGEKYRVAGSIIGGIKALIEKFPNTKFVTVLKQGEGKNTRYQVIPYQGETAPVVHPA